MSRKTLVSIKLIITLQLIVICFFSLSGCKEKQSNEERHLQGQSIHLPHGDTINLSVGETLEIKASAETPITYDSNNELVAQISDSGTLKALSFGTSIVRIQAESSNYYQSSYIDLTVNVRRKERTVKHNFDELETLFKNNQYQVVLNTNDDTRPNYTLSDDNSITISVEGKITATALGTTNLTIQYKETPYLSSWEYSAKIEVIDKRSPIIELLHKDLIQLNVEEQLSNPASSDVNQTVYYHSSNPNTASISETGVISALNKGSTTITASIPETDTTSYSSINYIVEVDLIPQSLKFLKDVENVGYLNDVYNNPAFGLGTGEITYQSQPPEISEVDIAGNLKILGSGKITVLANIEEDQKFAAADASYSIYSPLFLNAWIGSNSSELGFSNGYDHSQIYIANNSECRDNLDITCPDSILEEIDREPMLTSALSSKSTLFASISNPERTKNFEISPNQIPFRNSSQIVNFNSQFFLLGGCDVDCRNDVWSSKDGINWYLEQKHANFSAKGGHKVIEFNEKLWMYGGSKRYQTFRTIKSSENGIEWASEPTANSFPLDSYFSIVLLNNQLWALVKEKNQSQTNLWNSQDGINWQKIETEIPFSFSYKPNLYSLDNKLVVINSNGTNSWLSIDGLNWISHDIPNDIKINPNTGFVYNENLYFLDFKLGNASYSSDGVNWSKTNASGLPNTDRFEIISSATKVYLFKKESNNTDIGHVYSSNNISDWKKEALSNSISGRTNHQTVEFKNKLWLIGGHKLYTGKNNEVWVSGDGFQWDNLNTVSNLPARSNHQIIAFKNKLWLIGGIGTEKIEDSYSVADIWSSDDGINWNLETANAPFGPRSGHKVVAFKDKLWLVGGNRFDIWSSIDGRDWQFVANLNMPPRHSFQLAVHSQKLWIISGDSPDIYKSLSDVWASSDGITWDLITNNTPFTSREEHQVISHNGKLLLIGGSSGCYPGCVYSDIWSSLDGITWTEERASAETPFYNGYGFQLTKFKNRLVITGGRDSSYEYNKDIWSSKDGLNWQKALTRPIYLNN